jgi:hypothetical protein
MRRIEAPAEDFMITGTAHITALYRFEAITHSLLETINKALVFRMTTFLSDSSYIH